MAVSIREVDTVCERMMGCSASVTQGRGGRGELRTLLDFGPAISSGTVALKEQAVDVGFRVSRQDVESRSERFDRIPVSLLNR